MTKPKRISDASLPDKLEFAAQRACDPECEGRCPVCPADVMHEAAGALREMPIAVALIKTWRESAERAEARLALAEAYIEALEQNLNDFVDLKTMDEAIAWREPT